LDGALWYNNFKMTIRKEEIIYSGGKRGYPSKQAQTVCDIFCYEPENIEQSPLGNLYIVCQLSCVKDCLHLNNLLALLIKREYYSRPAKEAFKSFQAALKKANSHLNDLAKQGSLEWLGKTHFICAAIAGKNLFLAQAGEPLAVLWRQGKTANLSRKIIPENQKPDPRKFFSNVVCGKIEEEDKMILATPFINQLVSETGLKQIFANRFNIADIADQINKILREQKKPSPIAVLLLEAAAEPPLKEKSFLPKPSHVITPPIDLGEILK